MKQPLLRDNRGYPIGRPLHTLEATKTQQHMEPACNIHNIVNQWRETGVLVNTASLQKIPQYGDVSAVGNLQECLNTIKCAQSAFDALPSQIRTEMRNDPVELLRFVSEPNNLERAYQIGLLPRPPKPKPEPKPNPEPAPTPEELKAVREMRQKQQATA